MANKVQAAINAIRSIDTLGCDDLAQVLATLGCKMADNGFSDLDVHMIDEARDFVCGELAS